MTAGGERYLAQLRRLPSSDEPDCLHSYLSEMTTPPKSYAAAQEELEDILASLQSPEAPIDELAAAVRRAKELIQWLRTALRETEAEVESLLEDVDA